MKFTRRTLLSAFPALAATPALVPGLALAATPMRLGVIGAGSLGGTVGRL